MIKKKKTFKRFEIIVLHNNMNILHHHEINSSSSRVAILIQQHLNAIFNVK